MPKTHKRHKTLSFAKGDLVEYIGVDRNIPNRGIGIVLEEVAPYYYSSFYDIDGFHNIEEKQSTQYIQIRVYWQSASFEEILHKSRVRRIPEVSKANVNAKTKKTIKE